MSETRSSGQQVASPSQPATLEEILYTWKMREESITSASFTWKIDRTGFNRWSTYQTEYWCADQPAGSSAESEHNLQSLFLQGDKLRGETWRWRAQDYQEFVGFASDSTGPGAATRNAYFSAWKTRFSHIAAQEQSPYRHVWIFDGRARFDIHEGHTDEPVAFKMPGRVNDQGEYPYLTDVLSKPVMLACRPVQWPGTAISVKDLQMVGDAAVQGRHCTVAEYSTTPDASTRMWIDTDRDCQVLRLIYHEEGLARYQLDVEYRASATSGWAPQHWTVVLLNDSRHTPGRSDTIQFASCRVTECSANERLPDDLFDARLAAGTYVVDVATNQKYRVMGDGAKRPMSAQELVSVRNALEIANPDVNAEWHVHWYQIIAFLILLAGCGYLYRRRLRFAKLSTPHDPATKLDGGV